MRAEDLVAQKFDGVILATAVTRARSEDSGQDGPNVLSYIDVLAREKAVGERVVIVGAGGIGFDVAEFLVTPRAITDAQSQGVAHRVGRGRSGAGARRRVRAQPSPPARQVTLLQRQGGQARKGLGKTTGWIHRAALQMKRVEMIGGVNYERITPEGLLRHLRSRAQGWPAHRVRHDRAVRRTGATARVAGAAAGGGRCGAPDRRRRRSHRTRCQARHRAGNPPVGGALRR